MSGFVIGAVVERVIVRPVETGPEINAVIVTLGVFVGFIALAAILFGNTVQSFPAPFAVRGISVGEVNVAITPNDIYRLVAVLIAMALLLALFRFTNLGLQLRAAAFGQEVARLLGVRVSHMLTLGWALAGLFGSLAGILIAGGALVLPDYMDGVVVFGFVAAVLGGLDSFIGAVVGGLVLGLVTTYVAGYVDARARHAVRAGHPRDRAAPQARRPVLQLRRPEGVILDLLHARVRHRPRRAGRAQRDDEATAGGKTSAHAGGQRRAGCSSRAGRGQVDAAQARAAHAARLRRHRAPARDAVAVPRLAARAPWPTTCRPSPG